MDGDPGPGTWGRWVNGGVVALWLGGSVICGLGSLVPCGFVARWLCGLMALLPCGSGILGLWMDG